MMNIPARWKGTGVSAILPVPAGLVCRERSRDRVRAAAIKGEGAFRFPATAGVHAPGAKPPGPAS